jgi:hypothetical protein
MAKRHKGTTRKAETAKPRARTITRPEAVGATGEQMLAVLDRKNCERIIIETLNALCSRTARPDGRLCVAFHELDLATQYRAACLYLLDHKHLGEVRELVDLSAVATRVQERWILIVKEEYVLRYNAVLRTLATNQDLAVAKGDMPALAQAFWGELVVSAAAYLRTVTFADMDNNTRHLFLRMGEGLTDQAKVSTEISKTQAQTEKLRGQLLREVDAAGKRGNGTLSVRQVAELIEGVVGLPGGMLGGGVGVGVGGGVTA